MNFELGRLVITNGALEVLIQHDIFLALDRHIEKDWGELCKEDWELNDYAVKNNERLLSSYTDRNGIKFWIITEYDRSATTILLPEEY